MARPAARRVIKKGIPVHFSWKRWNSRTGDIFTACSDLSTDGEKGLDPREPRPLSRDPILP